MRRSATFDSAGRIDGWRDLLWYTAAAGAAVGLSPSAVQAQIVTVTIDEFIEDRAVFVDLDGDGDAEFELNEDDEGGDPPGPRDYTRFYQAPEDSDLGEGPDTVTGLIGEIFAGYDYPLPLDVGVTIGPDSEFQDYYLNTFTFEGSDPNGWIGTEAYVGMRIALDDGGDVTTHYGWVLVEIPSQGGAIVAVSAAYNTTPDAPIVTGDTGTSAEDDAVVTGTHRLSEAYPNPFTAATRFDLTVARAQRVTAELYNVLGQRVATLFEGDLAAENPRTITVDERGLPSGLYVVRVAGETFTDSFRVTLTK